MKHPKIVTWVVVANGARALVFQQNRKGNGLHQALPLDFVGRNAPAPDGVGPGVTHDRTGGSARATAPRCDAHRLEKLQLVRALADELVKAADNGVFRRLILVAPPQTLGDLRSALPARVRAMVRAEVPKDLTHIPTRAVFNKLAETLGR